MTPFLSGALGFGFWVAGLFFLRFWEKSRDRLFVYFTAAFWLMAAEHVVISLGGGVESSVFYVYLIRLVAFLLIIVGIIDKNRAR